jgi:hypothetical protein
MTRPLTWTLIGWVFLVLAVIGAHREAVVAGVVCLACSSILEAIRTQA